MERKVKGDTLSLRGDSKAVLGLVFLAGVMLFGVGAAKAAPKPAPRRVMNIVNFVRGCDPRDPKLDLVKPFRAEVELNTKYNLENTVLLQYDAILREDMMAVVKAADSERTEIGLWFEVVKPMVESAGLKWRGRNGWAWDWYINPGFLMAYTQEQRRILCDEAFRLFKETFGHYPESVGSWLLDAYSMDYMAERYGVKAFCICREQDNTDAYGLRGGYFNGAYYPSKRNMLSAAIDMENAVKTPVFKMLTPDPIYNYANSVGPGPHGPPTLEPVWESGQTKAITDWYFRIYAEDPKGLLGLSYMQTGQENSFGYDAIMKGLPYQIQRIAELRDKGLLSVEKMCDTGRRFAAENPANCVQTQVAMEDWRKLGRKSVWYNSKFYRANLLMDGKRLFFRDIHKMSDSYEEPYLHKVCKGWQALYYTPPVVDEFLFKTKDRTGVMTLDGEFASLEVATADDETLVATAKRTDGSTAEVRLTRGSIFVRGATLTFEGKDEFVQDMHRVGDALSMVFGNYRYKVKLDGQFAPTQKGYLLRPVNGVIALDLGRYVD
ncbi:MAG: hypothetical protein IJU44_00555 [Kiritimatiellae bacterium]|nr:hypothetical protein [Kiritimatiellia bacterium]